MTYCTHELRAKRVDEAMVTLRLLRRKHRLTLPELAAMLGIHHDTLQRWETGLHRPSKRNATRLVEFHQLWAKSAREAEAQEIARAEQSYQARLEVRGQRRITGT